MKHLLLFAFSRFMSTLTFGQTPYTTGDNLGPFSNLNAGIGSQEPSQKLLKKIEELTRYTIDHNWKMRTLTSKYDVLYESIGSNK